MPVDQSYIANLLQGYRGILQNGAGLVKPRSYLNINGATLSDNPNFVDPVSGQVVGATNLTVPNGTPGIVPFLIGSLRTIAVPTSSHQTQVVDGYNVQADGGQGVFVWNNGDTRPDDGGTIIQITGQSSGRWNRVYSGDINAKWFGAIGGGTGADDWAAIQAALDCAHNAFSGGIVPSDAYFPAPRVYLPSGHYTITKTLELPAGLSLIADKGTLLTPSSTSVHAIRTACAENRIQGLTIAGGKAAVVFFGPWSHYLGSSTPTGATQCVIEDCRFLYQSYPSLWNDTSLVLRASSGQLVVKNCWFQGSCFTYIGFDAAQIIDCYGVLSQLVANDGFAIVVKDDNSKVLPAFVSFDNIEFENFVGVTVGTDDTLTPRSAWMAGAGTFRSVESRWGGDAGNLTLGRSTTSLYTLNGQSLASVTSTSNLLSSASVVGGAVACTSGHNLWEVYDAFPKLLDFRLQELSVQTGLPSPSPPYLSIQSNGIYIDSGTCAKSTYLQGDRRNIVLNFEGFAFDAWRFRSGTDPTSQVGEEVTAQLRPYFRTPLSGNTLAGSPVPMVNLWPAAKYSLNDADYAQGSNFTAGDTETGTGYAVQAYRTQVDNNNTVAAGFYNVTNGLTGEYTISVFVAANYNGAVNISQTDPTAGTNAILLDTIPFEQGPSSGTTLAWQQVSTTVWLDGTNHGINFQFQHMPLHVQGNGANPAGEFYFAGMMLTPGRGAPPFYILPQATQLADGARSIVRVTNALSPYAAKPNSIVVVDCSAGNVVINAPALALGQFLEVKQDDSTAIAAHTITVNGNGSQTLARPSPNAGSFVAACTDVGALGVGLRWANLGSASGKLILVAVSS